MSEFLGWVTASDDAKTWKYVKVGFLVIVIVAGVAALIYGGHNVYEQFMHPKFPR